MDNEKLLGELLGTDEPSRVGELVHEYQVWLGSRATWHPVGGRLNNSATIQAASDPARALIERITNGLDAVIEREHKSHGGKPECSSPREAGNAWFGVPPEGLHKLSATGRRNLAMASVTVTLFEGAGRSARTVDVADAGLGLTAEQFPTTILSLNAENKISKFYLAGAFGQGGSATFADSQYTLIASRSTAGTGRVAFTVVMYQPPVDYKLGSYVYLMVDGAVPTVDAAPESFGAHSTRVRHYGYDLDDYAAALGPNSLYGRAQAILFDPVLPFWFENKVHGYSRTIKGSRAALAGARDDDDAESKLSHSCPIFFTKLGDFGQVGIEYWVLEPSGKAAPNKAFVNGTKPIVLTVNGQTHAEWSGGILKKDAELLHLASRMVVHLNGDRLSPEAKRVLFVSNREESRRGVVQNLLLQELLEALKSDERLRELEEEARLAGTKERDAKDEQEIRREVAKMLTILGFSVATDAGVRKGPGGEGGKPGGGRPARAKPAPIAPQEPPTLIEWVGDEAQFFPGQRRFLRIRTDALSTYHDASDPKASRFSFTSSAATIRLAGTSELRDGHMRVVFAADDTAIVGTTGELKAELHVPNGATLSAKMPWNIVKAPEKTAPGGKMNLPNIDCAAVHDPNGPEWAALMWGEDVSEVAASYEYQPSKDTLLIRYSTVFPRYRETLDGLQRKDPVRGQSFEKRFEIWLITVSVLIHWQDMTNDATPLSAADVNQDMLENYKRDEIRRMCKAAVVYARREVLLSASAAEAEQE